jgi:hypothetical protein
MIGKILNSTNGKKKTVLIKLKLRNPIAKDLHSTKYHMRVVKSKKLYSRVSKKHQLKKELAYG